MTNLRAAALLLLAFVSGASAEELTWKEANKKSAEALRGGDATTGATLAWQAFELYPAQTSRYDAKVHAQLLLNATDAREKAGGSNQALKDLDRGMALLRAKAGADDPNIVALLHEGARLAQQSPAKALAYYERAADHARRIWGPDDLRTINLDFMVANEGRSRAPYTRTRSLLKDARQRARQAPGGDGVLTNIEMSLARLEIENKTPLHAIPIYEALAERLESVADPGQRLKLQTIYAALEHAYEETGNKQAAAATRERLNATFEGGASPIIPIKRVTPEYPNTRQEGYVLVRVTVAPDGSVRDLAVVDSDPPGVFDKAALTAIARWTFKPRIVDGQPVEQVGFQRLNFTRE